MGSSRLPGKVLRKILGIPIVYDQNVPPGMRELVLLFDEEQQAAFAAHVRTLRDRYGLEGVTETVLRAVRDEALLVHRGEA